MSGVKTSVCLILLAVAAQAQTIRVLFLGGGSTSHDPLAMSQVMIPLMQAAGMAVDYRTNESVLAADSLSRYNVLFIYNAKKGSGAGGDGTPNLTTAQENALYAWVQGGHVIVGTHSANSSYLANPRYLQLFGAAFLDHGANVVPSISMVRPNHPAVAGTNPPPAASNPGYWDEDRRHTFSRTDTVVLSVVANDNRNPWTWVRPEGSGWVYYTSSGHDARVWNDANFQGQLIQALRWGAGISTSIRMGRGRDEALAVLRGQAPLSLRIADLRGKTVFFHRGAVDGFSALASGSYFLEISGTGQPVSRKSLVKW